MWVDVVADYMHNYLLLEQFLQVHLIIEENIIYPFYFFVYLGFILLIKINVVHENIRDMKEAEA